MGGKLADDLDIGCEPREAMGGVLLAFQKRSGNIAVRGNALVDGVGRIRQQGADRVFRFRSEAKKGGFCRCGAGGGAGHEALFDLSLSGYLCSAQKQDSNHTSFLAGLLSDSRILKDMHACGFSAGAGRLFAVARRREHGSLAARLRSPASSLSCFRPYSHHCARPYSGYRLRDHRRCSPPGRPKTRSKHSMRAMRLRCAVSTSQRAKKSSTSISESCKAACGYPNAAIGMFIDQVREV